MEETLKEIVNHLRNLGDGKIQPIDASCGLCWEISENFYVQLHALVMFSLYPNFSGSAEYPIPHSEFKASHAFNHFDNLWDDSAYGNERRKFCLWCADEIERTGGLRT